MGSIDRGPAPAEGVRARVAEVFRAEHARVVASVLRIVPRPPRRGPGRRARPRDARSRARA